MDITFSLDTDKPLSQTDRALLRALLDQETSPQHGRSRHDNRPAQPSITDRVFAATDSGAFAGKLPVSQQPGVTLTESTRDDDQSGD